ncbi:peptidoglycan DD-metalloendopeptidase family protein [Alkalicoccobacillus gibsonii]|uniref:peptidoglycan DD-metalloendopeptidase family protein n=1 Tax=Alkalicoccobacillus gibsonii TaxID=79881 RepID=UPI001FEC7321|nr:peptidoglycan DD-metalloendopeptidase family protein [Alkalicoccobacillus gibsonii]
MAKFTAKFDLEDRISKKLERMTRGLEKAEALAQKLDRIKLGAVDSITPAMAKINKQLDRSNNHTMHLNAKDSTKRVVEQANKRLKATPKQHTTMLLGEGKGLVKTVDSVNKKIERALPKNRVTILDADDRKLNRKINQIRAKVNRAIPKTVDVNFTARDRITAVTERISSRIKRSLIGRNYEFNIQAKDESTKVINRVNSFAKRTLGRGYTATIGVLDRLTAQVNRMSSHARSTLARSYAMTASLIDRATPGARKIYGYANSHLNRTFTMTVKIADYATRPLRKLSGMASSTGAMLGVGAGAYGGVVAPLRATADRQNMTTAFETLLGSREAADQRLDDLISFAGQTPFARDEIFEASRVLQIFTDGALAAGDGMKLVGDIAAGTQKPFADVSLWVGRLYDGLQNGRPIGDATAALQEMGAISGASRAKLEGLAESGRDISEIWPEATREFGRFDDMMIKMSDNLANLFLGVKSFMNNAIIMPWGAGLASVVQPALESFRSWRSENAYVITDMTKQMQVAGENFAQAVMNPMSKTFGFVGDQLRILFPGEMTPEMKERFKDDPNALKRFEELEQYRDLTLKARWDIVWPNIQEEFAAWWRDKGAPGLISGAESVGSTYGSVMGGLIRGLLGVEDESNNEFVTAGAMASRSFVDSFLDSIDPADLSKRLGQKLWDVNVTALKSNVGNVIGKEEWVQDGANTSAFLGNLIAGVVVGKILMALKPFKDIAVGLGRGVKGVKDIWNKTFGGKGPKPPKGPGTPKGGGKWASLFGLFSAFVPNGKGAGPINPNQPTLPTGGPKATTIEMPKRSFFPKWMTSGLKGIPLLGTSLSAAAIVGAPDEEKASVAGGALGGMAGGAATGALVGSVFPGVGTIVGGILGGIAGSIGGSKLGQYLQDIGVIDSIKNTIFNKDWWSEQWSATKVGAKVLYEDSWMQKTVNAIGDTVFSGSWWSSKWSSITEGTSALYEGSWLEKGITAIGDTLFNGDWWSGQWAEITEYASKLTDLSWWSNQIGELFGLLETTLFSGEWWSAKWAEAAQWSRQLYEGSWLEKTVSAIDNTVFNAEWWSGNWDSTVEGTKKLYEGSWLQGTLNAINDTVFNGEWWNQKWEDVKAWSTEKAIQIGGLGYKIKTGIEETVFSSEWWLEKWENVKSWTQSKWDSAKGIWTSIATNISDTVFNSEWWSGHWESVKSWTQDKWNSAQSIWDSVTTKIGETIFSGDWWNNKWESVKGWTQDKWDSAQSIWDSVRTTISDSLFSKDWWGDKWSNVLEWGKGILKGAGSWFDENVAAPFKEGRESGQAAGNASTTASQQKTSPTRHSAYSGHTPAYANGGFINRPHVGLVGEAGPEAIIPLSANRRSRALDLYEQTGSALGVRPYANGGLVGGSINASSPSTVAQPAAVSAVVSLDAVRTANMQKEANAYGQQFSEAVSAGVNRNTISLSAWKQRNISNPMQGIVQDAVGFGSGTVQSFSAGQNGTATGTRSHLHNQVKRPFEVIQGGASAHGSGTVQGFRSGQDASQTGTSTYLASQVTRPFNTIESEAPSHGRNTVTAFRSGQDASQTGTESYLQRQVHSPFNDTQAKGSSWGTGTMSEFVSGMRSHSSQVKEAAQFLADTVESTFKERLGIHSPSRVMFGLGEWTSLGILKGLDAVDLKKFANKQVDGLISAYTGMAPDFGSPFTMTSGFGMRKSPGGIGTTNHKGVDFAAPMGTPIPSQAPGMVTFSGWQGGYGNLVKIQGADGIEYMYGHNSKNLVKQSDMITGGQTIALVGSTGNSTGPHVHYETRRNGVAFNPMGGENALFGGSGADVSTRSAVAQAALATGVGKDWIDPLMTIAMKESGGNARAINNWDSNARRGVPSKGLMQTIDPTFNAHKLPGMDDIYNPVHNTAAAIRYIQSRYGDISNVPGIRSMRNGGAYRGYANGGLITNEQIARIGEGGRREWIIPTERGIRGRYLLNQAAADLGMQVIDQGDSDYDLPESVAQEIGLTSRPSIDSSSQIDNSSSTVQEGDVTVHINITGDNHYHNEVDMEKLAAIIKNDLAAVFRNMRLNGTVGVLSNG